MYHAFWFAQMRGCLRAIFFNMSEQHSRESTIQFMSGAKSMAAKCYKTLGEEMNGDVDVFTQ